MLLVIIRNCTFLGKSFHTAYTNIQLYLYVCTPHTPLTTVPSTEGLTPFLLSRLFLTVHAFYTLQEVFYKLFYRYKYFDTICA